MPYGAGRPADDARLYWRRKHLGGRSPAQPASAGHLGERYDVTRTMGVYEQLGVRPVINATCHWTAFGGSVMWPEVLEAMADARRHCVDMRALLDSASDVICRYTDAEASHVVSGCAAGLQ